MILIRNRKQKQKEYDIKYGDIPDNYYDRLSWMIDRYNLSESKMMEIANKRNAAINNLFFYTCKVIQLFEEPEGTHRPRFRIIRKNNFNQAAILDKEFIHVYTPNAQDDFNYMRKITEEKELSDIDGLINTPCIIQYDAYYKTPSYFSTTDTFLAEIGLFRPAITKPDWDNLGKKYCDMYNHNIWLDDSQVITGTVNKYYSIKPRVEITLWYLNSVYNKSQYNAIIGRKDYDGNGLYYLDKNGGLRND